MISRNPKVVSINNTTQIDLQGQVASEATAIATSPAPAANCSSSAAPTPGGKSFICLASTYEKHGQRRAAS